MTGNSNADMENIQESWKEMGTWRISGSLPNNFPSYDEQTGDSGSEFSYLSLSNCISIIKKNKRRQSKKQESSEGVDNLLKDRDFFDHYFEVLKRNCIRKAGLHPSAVFIDCSWKLANFQHFHGILLQMTRGYWGKIVWHSKEFQLSENQSTGTDSKNPVLKLCDFQGGIYKEDYFFIENLRREEQLDGINRVSFSVAVQGRKSRLVLALSSEREALVFAFLVKDMLQPGRYSPAECIFSTFSHLYPKIVLKGVLTEIRIV